ncbi:hypothetical protein [Mesorhizobium sp. A556]
MTAARSLGKTFIEAEQVFMEKPGDVDEMCWLALKANLTPGLRLTNAEKAASLRHYVKALQHRHPGPRGGRANGPFKTLREIGRDLGGMHHETVSRHLAKHAPNTLRAILEADLTASEDEPAEPIKGQFNVDTMRGRKAAEAVADPSAPVRVTRGGMPVWKKDRTIGAWAGIDVVENDVTGLRAVKHRPFPARL